MPTLDWCVSSPSTPLHFSLANKPLDSESSSARYYRLSLNAAI